MFVTASFHRLKYLGLSLLGVLMLSLNAPAAMGQGCVAIERELQEYFLAYHPGSPIDLVRIEKVRDRCPMPTDKIELIYQYFLAMRAMNEAESGNRYAYSDAIQHYRAASTYFPYLLQADATEARFVDLFFERAEGLEAALYSQGYTLNQPATYAYGNSQGSAQPLPATELTWEKNSPYRQVDAQPQGRTRGMDAPAEPPVFEKNYPQADRYVSGNRTRGSEPLPVTYDRGGERYGYVGDLQALNPLTYLKFRRHPAMVSSQAINETPGARAYSGTPEATYRTATPAPTGRYRGESVRLGTGNAEHPAYVETWYDEPAPTTRGMDPGNQRQASTLRTADLPSGMKRPDASLANLWTSLKAGTPIRTEPSATASIVGRVDFGQSVSQLSGSQPVVNGGRPFVPVQLPGGKAAWIETTDMVREGRLAVLTGAERGFASLYARADRNVVLFEPGELVILEDMRDDWIRIATRNSAKRGWISSIENLTIEAGEIEIARQLAEALTDTQASSRLAKLQAITRVPGFRGYQLSDLVLRYLQAEMR